MPADYSRKVQFYLHWHYTTGLGELVRIWSNFLEFFYHFYSLPLLARTLLSPFKRVYKAKERPGFSWEDTLDRLSWNIVSRAIGAIVRSAVIVIGLANIIFTVLAGMLIIIVWIVLPGCSYLFYLAANRSTLRVYHLSHDSQPVRLMSEILATDWGRFFTLRLGLTGQELTSVLSASPALTPRIEKRVAMSPGEVMLLLYDHNRALSDFFFGRAISREDIVWVNAWYHRREEAEGKRRAFWERDFLLHIPSIGKNWTYGYTPVLDRFTIELAFTAIPYAHFAGRDREIAEMERILTRRTHGNVLLVGDPGVGKHPLVIYFAHRVAEGRVLPAIENKRLLELNVEQIFGSEVDTVQRKSTLTSVLAEAQAAGNIILVIDEFDRFVASGPDRIDLSDVFAHAVSRGRIALIAVLIPGAYHQYIVPNKNLVNKFGLVEVKPINKSEALMVIADILPSFEEKGQYFDYQALREIAESADRYLKEDPFPDKAISLLDQAAGHAAAAGKQGAITTADVKRLVATIAHVPQTLTQDDAGKLMRLEDILHQRVIGQDEAVTAIARAMRRARTDVSARRDKPIGTFLFLGPTGVGKTETAKALAEAFFGMDTTITRFDMSEFQEASSIRQFLGEFTTGKVGVFAQKVRENPYTVLLLDEIEKASKNILNIFLPAIDEGYLTDAFGKKLYITNMIVIATSNAGAEFIRESIREGIARDSLTKRVLEYVQREGIFAPEFINRFDAVTVFHPLTAEHAARVADLALARIIHKFKEEKGITVRISSETKATILTYGFDQVYGGRAINRAIQRYVEDPLAQKILNNQAPRGSVVTI